MPQGLEVYDAQGRLVFDATTRLTRTIDQITIAAGSTGSVTIPAIQGLPFLFLHLDGGYVPIIDVTGQTISWSPNASYPGGMVDVIINYGGY
ncbi:MAG TPA: hypothetical protein VLF15_11710 [Pseudoxanthomonas sp.]|nr:hypothetical protein [Pseudoxanthomonas sp.]